MTPVQALRPREQSPRSFLQKMIGGFRPAQMISVAAKLRIADLLAEGQKAIADLASGAQCHEDSLYRLLRALAAMGIFAEEGDASFRLTPAAEFLRSDVTGSLRNTAEAIGEDWMWRPWGCLLHSVRTGETAFDHIYGQNTWDWFTTDPEAAGLFNELMDEVTVADALEVMDAYDFGGAGSVVDVGGGRGVLLAEILRRNRSLRGILFNLPHVIESARAARRNRGPHRVRVLQTFFRRRRAAETYTS